MLKRFVKAGVDLIRRRGLFLIVFNFAFFWSLVIGALVARFMFWPPPPDSGIAGNVPSDVYGWIIFAVGIFLSNLFWTGFAYTTLGGSVFFVLSPAALIYRGLLWGISLSLVSFESAMFLLPTALLEGEAYVLCALVGFDVGLSWLKPQWIYKNETGISRWFSFKYAVREGLCFYVLITVVLALAAVVETLVLYFSST